MCHALSITPILCSIYATPQDAELAGKLSDQCVQTKDLPAARALADELGAKGHPSIVIGDAKMLDMVYAEGRRECLKAE